MTMLDIINVITIRAEIFENPVTIKPWHDERSQIDHYWKPTLKRLGIRARRAYQTRHTCATTELMTGVNPVYIARQLGHTNANVLFTMPREKSRSTPRIATAEKQKWKPDCASIHYLLSTIFIK